MGIVINTITSILWLGDNVRYLNYLRNYYVRIAISMKALLLVLAYIIKNQFFWIQLTITTLISGYCWLLMTEGCWLLRNCIVIWKKVVFIICYKVSRLYLWMLCLALQEIVSFDRACDLFFKLLIIAVCCLVDLYISKFI